jgi:hypothetical protein
LLKDENIFWRFGIDSGECFYSWSPEAGFSVSGRPSIRAKILASRTSRYKIRALITDFVHKTIIGKGKKIGTLYDDEDAFFELTEND